MHVGNCSICAYMHAFSIHVLASRLCKCTIDYLHFITFSVLACMCVLIRTGIERTLICLRTSVVQLCPSTVVICFFKYLCHRREIKNASNECEQRHSRGATQCKLPDDEVANPTASLIDT